MGRRGQKDALSIQRLSTLYLYGMKVYKQSIIKCIDINLRFGKHKTISNRKVSLEIVLPVEFKIWIEKCKYLERMKEIIQ